MELIRRYVARRICGTESSLFPRIGLTQIGIR
jgi:hypothetical protein